MCICRYITGAKISATFLQHVCFFFAPLFSLQRPDTQTRNEVEMDFGRGRYAFCASNASANEHEPRMSLKENDHGATRGLCNSNRARGTDLTPAGRPAGKQAPAFLSCVLGTVYVMCIRNVRPNEGISQRVIYLSSVPAGPDDPRFYM